MNATLSRGFSVLIILFSLYAFLTAEIDFSYDYSVYLYFAEHCFILDFGHLNRSLISNLPMPYVVVPPAAALEYGYVALSLVLGSLGLSASASYAVIGSSSIALRAYVLSKAQTGLLLNILLALSFITLFEANALRAGVASSMILIAMLLFLRERYAWAALAVSASFLIHIQSLAYMMTFAAGMGIYVVTVNKPYHRVALILIGTALTFVAMPVANVLFSTKVEDYTLRVSEENHTTGINIISLLSLVILAVSLRAVPKVVKVVSGVYPLTWIASLFAFSQVTIFLIFGASFADIGVRLWQFAFLIMTVAAIFLRTRINDPEANEVFRHVMIAIYLCVAAESINVIFRYPLSNFFYPLVPYIPINYARL